MSFAFVFPGQGSQSVGMMNAYQGLPLNRATFDEASEALGEDLWALMNSGPEEALSLTINTQPVMLAAGVAVYRSWQALNGPKPFCLAGHSLGEYSALVAAESLNFADAMRLSRFRAQTMHKRCPRVWGPWPLF